ncbi:MAG TPA: class I SAM-dependent methyltransferase [Dehalococcoidia bacterium]|nr:class I SAM-dependent methyltransferase [Dehalococcoidia bacterium]
MREDQIEYWINPTPENLPHTYLEHNGRSDMLVDIVKKKIALENNRTILEVGCNVGRNLSSLESAGYTHLAGVDVNSKALDMVQAKACLMHGPIEKVLPRILQPYGLVFTMAVLQHIPPENDKVFEHIARLGRYNLLTIENEVSQNSRHFPRNYKTVFEKLGMKQIRGWRQLIDLPTNFVMRWFKE